jgi:hypothetical protein
LEAGIVIKRIIYLSKLTAPRAVAMKNSERISANRPEIIQGTYGQRSAHNRTTADLHVIVLVPINEINSTAIL